MLKMAFQLQLLLEESSSLAPLAILLFVFRKMTLLLQWRQRGSGRFLGHNFRNVAF
jgi:hypothetical protein